MTLGTNKVIQNQQGWFFSYGAKQNSILSCEPVDIRATTWVRSSQQMKQLTKKQSDDAKMDKLIWAAGSFDEVIRKARVDAGLNKSELAKACAKLSPRGKFSAMYISQIEKGDRVPSVKACRLLAKALNLDEQRLQLLAHRFRPRKELRDLLTREELEVDGNKIDNRISALLRTWKQLPQEQRDQIAKVWEDALRLVVK